MLQTDGPNKLCLAAAQKIFFHPDCTVGTGITPVQLALADFTAGRELRPALKIHIDYGIYDTCLHIACQAFCNLLYYIIILY